MSSGYCTREELASHFGVSPHTVGGWIRRGNVFPMGTVVKMGQTYRFKLKEIEQYFMEQAFITAPKVPEEGAPEQLELPLEMPEEAATSPFDADEDV